MELKEKRYNKEITEMSKNIFCEALDISSDFIKKLVFQRDVFVVRLNLDKLNLKVLSNEIFEINYKMNNIYCFFKTKVVFSGDLDDPDIIGEKYDNQIKTLIKEDLKIIKYHIFKIFKFQDVKYSEKHETIVSENEINEFNKKIKKHFSISLNFNLNDLNKMKSNNLSEKIIKNCLTVFLKDKGFFEEKDIDLFYYVFSRSNSELITFHDEYELRLKKELNECPKSFNSEIEYETFKELLLMNYKF